MVRLLLSSLLVLTPPANAELNFGFQPEFDDSFTSELDPFAPRGLKVSYLSSVVIHSVKEKELAGSGSGNYFRLGKHRFIITAAHVVDNNDITFIMERGFDKTGDLTEANIVYIDKDSDIAILVPVEKLKHTKAIPFRRDINNQIGEKTYHTGHPSSQGWHISEGILSGTLDDVLMINTFAWPGSSGSIVFDEGGRVIGVLSAIKVDGPLGLPVLIEHIVMAGNIKQLDQETLVATLKSNKN